MAITYCRLEAIASTLEAIAFRLEAIASRLEASAIRWGDGLLGSDVIVDNASAGLGRIKTESVPGGVSGMSLLNEGKGRLALVYC